MNKLTEIEVGRLHYKLDDSGFWVNQYPTDPMSATVTSGELWHILESSLVGGQELVRKVEERIEYIKDCMNKLEIKNG